MTLLPISPSRRRFAVKRNWLPLLVTAIGLALWAAGVVLVRGLTSP